jgi:hypothetical protein
MPTFADKAFQYFTHLKIPRNISSEFQIVNPYENAEVKRVLPLFYENFYNDSNERLFVFGINHGRFGGGLTGLSFTDPVALKEFCGIENSLGSRRELSSKFIYLDIERYGGVRKFFSKVFLTSLYPFTILTDGLNCNYYDDKELYKALKQSIVSSVEEQIKIGARGDVVVCLGRRNGKYLEEINKEYKFFEKIFVLDHPRWVMQYRLKSIEKYIEEYLKVLKM